MSETRGTIPEEDEDGVEIDSADGGTEHPFDAEKIAISPVVVPLSRLVDRLRAESIKAPELQRQAGLWSHVQKSRLIESLMLRIPLPSFYVAADEDENWYIIDGLQRTSTIREFFIDKSFRLKGLEFLGRIAEGKSFDELPPLYQNRIMDTQFQFSVLSATTPQDVRYNVFKRLNTGGLALLPQEIRHALCYGPSAALLEELAKSEEFKRATDNSIRSERMMDCELVLRFIAFLVRGENAYPNNDDMDAFLVDTMLLLNAMPDMDARKLQRIRVSRSPEVNTTCKYVSYDEIRDKFKLSMQRTYDLFGVFSFRKTIPSSREKDRSPSGSNPTFRSPVNKAMFETVGVVLAEMSERDFEILLQNKEGLFDSLYAELYEGKAELTILISRDSHKSAQVRRRFRKIQDIFLGASCNFFD